MKRIVIAINDGWVSTQFGLNNFSGNLIISGEEVEYIIHRHPLMKIHRGDRLQTNFDIVIDNSTADQMKPLVNLLPAHRRFANMRESKSITRFKLNVAGKGESGFVNIGAWANDDNILQCDSGQFGNDFHGTVVLKDEFGARGIGQVVFDISKISPADVMAQLNKLAKMVSSSDQNSTDDEFLLAEFHRSIPEAKFGYDTNNGVRESLRAVTENKLYLEEYIPDILAEYRILFAPGEQYIFHRNIEIVDGYPQACGAKGGMKDPLTGPELSKITDVFKAAIRVLAKAGITYGSADLFTTKNGWGLFEYSSQFGANGVNPLYSAAIQEALIKHVVENFLQGEK